MKPAIIFAIILIVLIGGSYFIFGRNNSEEPATNQNYSEGKNIPQEIPKNMKATMKTNLGDIELELFSSQAPNTVSNFTRLAESGFYKNTKFHRVIKGFMIQGGDPLSADDSKEAYWGTGGPGYKFDDEIGKDNRNSAGTISMANAGPNTNGSQFFINTADNNYLDAKHTVFGKVISGMDIVRAIENVQTNENDRPISPVIVQSVEVLMLP